MRNRRVFGRVYKQRVAGLLLALLLLESTASLLETGWTSFFERVDAAQVTIDATTTGTASEMLHLGHQVVFISDQVGYSFYVDSTGVCSYSKTTNGGTSWGGAVIVDSQTDCFGITVWYDRWTPGDTSGTYIHIVTADAGNDDVWYNRLDTSSDTRLLAAAPVSAVTGSGQSGSLNTQANAPSITKGTDGTLYIAMADSTDSYVLQCTTTCNVAGNWTETGTNPMTPLADDTAQILPLAGGDLMLIVRDVSAEDIITKIWDDSAGSWSGTFTTVDAAAFDNAAYDPQFAAFTDIDTGYVHLVYIDNSTGGTLGGGNDSIKTAIFNGSSWAAAGNVVTSSSRGLTQVAAVMNPNNSEVYVAYAGQLTPPNATSSNVYWATSTAAMTSWSASQGPLNTTQQDVYGLSISGYNFERIYATWYGAVPDDLFGNTIADISPFTVVSTLGSQQAEVRASTTDFYVGGTFVIAENVTSRSVTNISINETGTVDGSAYINNVRLVYDVDTSTPYNCVSESYSGSETQFGTTDTNGFSGADGSSSFSDSVTISPTQTLCVYAVLDVVKDAPDTSTLDIEISNPPTDVIVTGGVLAVPKTTVVSTGATTIRDSELTQTHFHWRNDNGNETAATSRTGGAQDTSLTALQKLSPVRLRLDVSNEGSTSSLPTAFRVEYATNPSTCTAVSSWTDIGAASDAFDMFDSSFVTDGSNTTNISIASGGVSDENSSFLTPNGGLRDTSSQTGSLTLQTTNFVELEFSFQATASAVEGESYCFRVSAAGESLPVYNAYPQVTIAADVSVSATGTQAVSADIPSTDQNLGGQFVITENSSSRTVTDITLTDTGTSDTTTELSDVKLVYDFDTTAPYNCLSESYSGSELQYGATVSSYSSDNGTALFSDSVNISTTQSLCLYVVYTVTEAASNADTVDFTINSPSTDVVVTGGGSVSPSTVIDINGSTTLSGAIVTQTGYHWRNDDGNEAGATSATGGAENVPVADFGKDEPIRLRVQISNEGATTSVPRQYGLEYGIKSTTCESIVVWLDADDGGISWSMFDSTFLTHGNDTTDISVGAGGITNPGGKTFLTPNSGIRETTSFSATTTLSATQFLELEFSVTSKEETPNEADYCFRLTQNGQPLLAYDVYPEISIEPRRDFKIQQGERIVTGTGATTLVAGVDYEAPSATTTAFVRITNSNLSGAGRNALGGNQNAEDYGAYIVIPTDITTSFQIVRDTDAVDNTYVAWEIIEYIGPEGGDNEMIVRDQRRLTLGTTVNQATGTAIPSVSDDSDVVVYITGQFHNGPNRTEAFSHMFTSSWNAGTNQPVLTRGANGGNTGQVSYAVVEFTGQNWKIQRVQHQFSAVGAPETESITAVNSLSRTFLHTQKSYVSSATLANGGHDVYLSSIGLVTFYLSPNATNPATHTSVAWVIENTQTANGAMVVIPSNGNTTGGSEPLLLSVAISPPVNDVNNASIHTVTYENGTGDSFPRSMVGAFITSTSTYQLWRSETSGGFPLFYRTEIIQWPAADLTIRQNDYRVYVDSSTLTPNDPWPLGATDLGENTPVSTADEPLSDGDTIRIRLSARIDNATLPAGFLTVKLQYGARATTCSAVGTWTDLGAPGSGEIWRGFDAPAVSDGLSLSTDPPTGGDLLLAVADVAGRYVEANPASANQFAVARGEDIEYDWHIQQNGAAQKTTYCFRMVRADGLDLDAYFDYPQIRTEGYAPATQEWRWYDDEINETPTVPLAPESIAPTDVDKGSLLKLRVTVAELKNLSQTNSRFSLQYSTDPNFTFASEPTATSSCVDASIWCFADGAGADNAPITTAVLSDSDPCVASVGAGCGLRTESNIPYTGFTHTAATSLETEFVLQYTNVDRNFGQVYYFRLFDLANNEPVGARSGYSPISIAGESARLTFSVSGIDADTTVAGVETTATTTPSSIAFGTLIHTDDYAAAQRLTLTTNAFEGYQVLMTAGSQLINVYGDPIQSLPATNAAPASFVTSCALNTNGCFGYHTTDSTLQGGSTRFSPLDSYAGVATTADEVMYSSIPTGGDQHDVLYRVNVSELQPAGAYETTISYIAVPVY